MQDFRNLKVWQKAHNLTLAVYKATAEFPKYETFGLRSQVRRATAAIPNNLAEGCGRGTPGDFRRFVQIAMGSAWEVDYLLLLCRDLNYLAVEVYTSLSNDTFEVKRMLSGPYNALTTGDEQSGTEN
jgi:four helix bundle protein